jgi:hypothetical protein
VSKTEVNERSIIHLNRVRNQPSRRSKPLYTCNSGSFKGPKNDGKLTPKIGGKIPTCRDPSPRVSSRRPTGLIIPLPLPNTSSPSNTCYLEDPPPTKPISSLLCTSPCQPISSLLHPSYHLLPAQPILLALGHALHPTPLL